VWCACVCVCLLEYVCVCSIARVCVAEANIDLLGTVVACQTKTICQIMSFVYHGVCGDVIHV